jgi:hypothetical protein
MAKSGGSPRALFSIQVTLELDERDAIERAGGSLTELGRRIGDWWRGLE